MVIVWIHAPPEYRLPVWAQRIRRIRDGRNVAHRYKPTRLVLRRPPLCMYHYRDKPLFRLGEYAPPSDNDHYRRAAKATAEATIANGVITAVSNIQHGSGTFTGTNIAYTWGTFWNEPQRGSGATFTFTVSSGQVTAVTVVNGGTGYRKPCNASVSYRSGAPSYYEDKTKASYYQNRPNARRAPTARHRAATYPLRHHQPMNTDAPCQPPTGRAHRPASGDGEGSAAVRPGL